MKKTNNLADLQIYPHSRILIAMPHPDDEAVFTAGLIHQLTSHQIPVQAITFTHGERSSHRFGLSANQDLSTVRYQELKQAYAILATHDHHVLDLPDGDLEKHQSTIKSILQQHIKQFNPTHLLTLEPDGIYGHPDHVSLSQVATSLATKKHQVLYATLGPNHMLPTSKHMAKIKTINPIPAQYKLNLPLASIRIKLQALASHRSQLHPLYHFSAYLFFLRNQLLTSEFYSYYQ